MTRIVTVLSLALALLLAAVATSPAAQKGVATDITWGIGQASMEKEGELIADLGAQWATVDISWRAAETADGTYEQAELDRLAEGIRIARLAGARVLLTVAETPSWASGNADSRYPPSDPAKLAEFYEYLVGRFAAEVDAWQVWNEPNHPHFWQPDPGADPNACMGYGAMLKAVAPVIRSADPTSRVLFAGLAWNDYAYLERCLELMPDLPDHFDVTVLHPYAMGGAAPETLQDASPADGRLDYQTFLAYREVRATLVAHGAPRPIWFSEMGWSSCTDSHPLGCMSREQQADYLTRAYEVLEQDDYVQVAIWYSLRNIGSDGPSWLDQLGLHTSDFTPKPAAAAFRAYAPPVPPADEEPVPGSPPPVAGPITSNPDPGAGTPTTTAGGRRATKLSLRVRRLRGRVLRLSGRATGPTSGRVTIRIERRGRDGRYRVSRRPSAAIRSRGAFARRVRLPRGGRWRARARFAGTTDLAPSVSRAVAFRTRR